MTDLNANPGPKRGGFAKDRRTGQIVRVKEIGGTDALVHPAYKSDGFWVQKTDLVPVPDPHEWKPRHLLVLLALLAFTAFVCTSAWIALDGTGTYEQFLYGVLSPGALVLSQGGRLLGLFRD